jgi:hypothetical protein
LNGNRVWGASPYEADLAVRGTELNERFGFFSNCEESDNPELCKELTGLVTELSLDPLLWADALFATAKIVRATSRLDNVGVSQQASALPPGVEIPSSTVPRGERVATDLEDFASSVYKNTTLLGAASALAKPLGNLLPFSPFTETMNVMNRAINRVLDMPAPSFFLPRSTREAAEVFGYTPAGRSSRPTRAVPTEGFQDAPFRPAWRDVLFQQGQAAYVKPNRVNPLLGSPETGLSAAETAVGRDTVLKGVAARGASEMQAALTTGLTDDKVFRMPWIKAALPNAKVVKPEHRDYVDALGMVVSDVLENVGVTGTWRNNKQLSDRVKRLSQLYGMPLEDVVQRIDNAVAAGNKVTLQTGYHVSGYQDFVVALDQTVLPGIDNGLLPFGVTPGDVRRALELRLGNVDLQEAELANQIVMARPDITNAEFASDGSRDAVQRILNLWDSEPAKYDTWMLGLQERLAAAGRADLAAFSPESYLQGLASGYMRREFETVNNLEAVRNAISNRSLIVMRNLRVDSANNPIGKMFGKEAGAAFANYVEVIAPPKPRNVIAQQRAKEARRPAMDDAPSQDVAFLREWFEETGTQKTVPYRRAVHFTTEGAADAINRQTGLNLTPEDIANAVWENSSSKTFLEKTIQLLSESAGQVPGSSGLRMPWSQTPSAFEAREVFDLPALAQLVMVRDPVAVAASTGMRAGRQVRAKSFLSEAYDFLSTEGLILNPSEVGLPQGQVLPQDAIYPFQTGDGVKYVALPNQPELWGPLAGQAIPEDIARTFVYAQRYGLTESNDAQRLFNMWRQMLLSPLPTSLRNVVSQYILISQAGGDLGQLLANTPRAHTFSTNFSKTGVLPDEFKGYEHLFTWISGSTLAGTVEVPTEKLLRRIVSNQQNLTGALEGAEEFVSWMTRTPPFGFLGLFKWGEETSRTSAFLSTYDNLIANGVNKSEAINRAAHFAANSAHNYGMAPLLPDMMKRYGLSAFPQFSYFMISRNVRTALENPGTLVKPEYARRAVNTWATEGDLEEQERVTALMAGWERYAYPLLLPIPNRNGEYYAVDLGFFFPTQSGSGAQVFADPFTGVALAPIFDAALAWINDNGRGPFGARFGQQVFDPAAETGDRVLQTADFLGSSYFMPRLVGPNGSIRQMMDAAEYNENKELFDLIGLQQGKHYNLDWGQVFARNLGLNARKVSVRASGVNVGQRDREINQYYDRRATPLNRRMTEMVMLLSQTTGDDRAKLQEDLQELQTRISRLEQDRARDIENLYKIVR